MSQAKVDQYKKEKANRRETIAREKRNKKLIKLCGGLVVVALAAWIGISVADTIKENRPAQTIYVDVAELDNYITGLFTETK